MSVSVPVYVYVLINLDIVFIFRPVSVRNCSFKKNKIKNSKSQKVAPAARSCGMAPGYEHALPELIKKGQC